MLKGGPGDARRTVATPGLAILTVLAFNTHWIEFFRLGTGSVSVVLAGVVLSLIPVLVVYTIGQRYLIEGIAMGGLKG